MSPAACAQETHANQRQLLEKPSGHTANHVVDQSAVSTRHCAVVLVAIGGAEQNLIVFALN